MAGHPSGYVRQVMQEIAPKLAEVANDLVLGDIWERPGLSKRDRSLITVAALMALYRPDELRLHLRRALANGVTREELGELITHIALYAGVPTAATAVLVAREVYQEQDQQA